MEQTAKPTLAKRIGATLAAALIASCMAAPLAFADSNGNAGTTLKVKMIERTVSSDPGDTGGSDYINYGGTGAENVKFSIPSEMVYDMAADGTLTCSTTTPTIANTGTVGLHVSNMKAVAINDFSFVTAGTELTSADENKVEMVFANSNYVPTPSLTLSEGDGQMDLSTYSTKKAVATPSFATDNGAAWNLDSSMTPAKSVVISSQGKMSQKVTKDITTATNFGKVTWYVTTGLIS